MLSMTSFNRWYLNYDHPIEKNIFSHWSEYIAGIPQGIQLFGYECTKKHAPNMLSFYEKVFLPELVGRIKQLSIPDE